MSKIGAVLGSGGSSIAHRAIYFVIAVLVLCPHAFGQSVTLSPAALTFGSQILNTSSSPRNVTLTNSGSALLTLSISISGDYSQTNTCGASVDVGKNCMISVTFTPTGVGARTGKVTITDNASNSPQTVSLNGAGVMDVSLFPSSITFAPQTVGSTSAAKSINVTNNQSVALTITSIVPSGDFAQTNTCGASLASNSKCSISVTFTPTVVGTRTGTITMTDSAKTSPQVVTLTGTGAALKLISITVTPQSPVLSVNSTLQFTATGNYNNGTKQDLTNSVTWSTGSGSIATITSGGLATGKAQGSTSVKAVSGTISGSSTVSVVSQVLVSIAVTPANPSITAGNTEQFTATGTYSDNSTQNLTNTAMWTSSKTTVATMNSTGLASNTTVGSTTIAAAVGSVNGSTLLTVTATTLVSIAVTPANASISASATEQFTATGTYSDTSTQNITTQVNWTSSSSSVTISNATGKNGLATGVSSGTSTITATLGAVSGNTSLTVTSGGLVFGTYLGGSGSDIAHGIVTDISNNMYIVGLTTSKNFPVLNAFQSQLAGIANAFVTKFNADGTLAWSTYFGGSGNDKAQAVAVDTAGNIYVTGTTSSKNFPVTAGVVQPKIGVGDNAFVAKFSPTGTLIWSTYLGGPFSAGNSLALDSTDNVFVAGDVNGNTNLNGFVTEINPTATSIIFTATIGGTKTDSIRSIAVAGEEAYVTGYTNSTDFPVTAGAFQTSCGTSCSDFFNGFVAKIGSGGVSYATYLGGTSTTVAGTTLNLGIGIAVDSSGEAYVTGTTNTTDFPVTTGVFQTIYGGTTDLPGGVASCIDFISEKLPCGDAYVVKLNPTGTAIDWATYLGGSTADIGYAIKLDGSGNVWIGGYTQSYKSNTHVPFPTTSNAFQSAKGGGLDMFLTEMSPTGSSLIYSTYVGGSFDENAYGLAVDAEGNGYLAGRTIAKNSPVSTNAFQSTLGGIVNAYIVKILP